MSNGPGTPFTNITPSSTSSSSSGGENGATVRMSKSRAEDLSTSQLDRARITSPLQHSFPSILINDTQINSDSLTDTPTRSARSTQIEIKRGRGMSRSSSVPLSIHGHGSQAHTNIDSISPPSTVVTPDMTLSNRHKESNVKHLTCYWWKEKGHCRFSDEQCLYAHHDTGHYTDAPRQIVPGEPALAGRKLGRAMRELALNPHRSSGSLGSMPGSRHTSRPGTPVYGADYGTFSTISMSSPLTSPIALPNNLSNDFDLARLNSDNQFLRNIVDQNGKEKGIMITTIENLQADLKGMKGELEGLRKAQEQLLTEREGLHKRIEELEQDQIQHLPMPPRVTSNPFGTIGRGRVNVEKRFVGSLRNDE